MIQKTLLLIVGFWVYLPVLHGQSSNRTTPKQFVWVYELPSSYPRGPMDITVKGQYHFERQLVGYTYKVRLHCTINSLEHNPIVFSSLRYKYNGVVYRQDQMNATDQMGFYGFSQLKIIRITALVDVSFLENSKTVSIGDNISKEVGETTKEADLNQLNIEWAGSRITFVNWDGSIVLENRIKKLNQPKTNTAVANSISGNSPRVQKPNQLSETKSKPNINSSSNSSTPSSSANNSNTTNHNIVTKTDAPIILPSAEDQMRQLGIDPEQHTIEKTVEMGIALLSDLFESRKERREKEEKENLARKEAMKKLQEAKEKAATQTYIKLYNENYLSKYYSLAKEGDVKSKVILLLKLAEYNKRCNYRGEEILECNHEALMATLPEYNEWLLELITDNNFDAINLMSSIILDDKEIKEYQLDILNTAANLGSLDAMIALGSYFNYNISVNGGMDARKALEWYEKAANAGCPMGAYYLGMIYMYGSTNDPSENVTTTVKHTVKKNPVEALKWFNKSISVENYQESEFGKFAIATSFVTGYSFVKTFGGTAFSAMHPDAYFQLAKIYRKDSIVMKDDALATVLENEGNRLVKFYQSF